MYMRVYELCVYVVHVHVVTVPSLAHADSCRPRPVKRNMHGQKKRKLAKLYFDIMIYYYTFFTF